MDNLTALRQERAALVVELRAAVDAAETRGGPNAEDQATIGKIEVGLRALDARIANLELAQRAEASLSNGQGTQTGEDALRSGGEDEEYREAFVAMLRGDADADQLRSLRRGYVQDEARDQLKGTAVKGGYIAPPEFEKTLLARIEELSVIRTVFTNVLQTQVGTDLTLTQEDARGAAAWLDEGAAFVAADETFKQHTLKAWKAGRLVKASLELVEDSFFPLDTYLAQKAGESVQILEDAAFVNGDGTSKPRGFMLDAQVGVTSADTTAITKPDEILDLVYSVRPTYRKRGVFIVADLAVRDLRKIKDTQGRYIWQDALRGDEPPTLLGYKAITEVNLAAPAATTKPLAFGDPSVYQIRQVNGVRMARLNERYLADEGKIGFLAWRRIDGKLLDSAAIKVLQMHA